MSKNLDYDELKRYETFFYEIFSRKNEKREITESFDLIKAKKHYEGEKKKKHIYFKKDNLYVVKKFFTEGIQYVPEGEEHHFEVLGKRPIDIVVLKNSKELPINSINHNFVKPDELVRAEPNQIYTVGRDCCSRYYLILTPYKACFKKTITKSNEVPSLSSDGDQVLIENDIQREGTEESRNLESSDLSVHRPSMHLEESNGGSDFEEKPSPSSDGDHLERENDTTREGMEGSRNLLESSDYSVHREESKGGSDFEGKVGDKNQKRSSEKPGGQQKRRKLNDQRSENLISGRDSGTSSNMDLMNMNPINGQVQSTSVEVTVNDQSSIGSGNVFGIRKNVCIESYRLDPDSTFEIRPDEFLSGRFTISNQDMDPYLISYECEGRIIIEKSFFKNGSVFETLLEVSTELLEDLRYYNVQGPAKEKYVVRYFYQSAFKKIEAIYKRFVEMCSIGMIGSCVPAIVQWNNTRFTGRLPDIYDTSDRGFCEII
ncbi:uncharacterized protein TNCT_374371 [Trichonephila clavata]|uniref:Uncharacterized protein n=1 Tax=Trichonephila clavata TaxID=2740835 RepID=A0A8X6J1V2_TRICU|nr:uncharacterized protein TNCT_374371 [Trichonephila clavata]